MVYNTNKFDAEVNILKPKNLSHIRQLNKKNVLMALWENGPISRADLSRLTKLHKSTISSLMNELIDEGLVVELGEGKSKIGRKPTLLHLNKDFPLFIAIDIKVRDTFIALYDLSAVRKKITKFNNSNLLTRPEKYVERLYKTLMDFLETKEYDSIKAIGVSVQGMTNHSDGKVLFAPNMGWKNVPLGTMLKKYFDNDLEILIDNDANLALLAEKWRGSVLRKEDKSAVFLSVNEGVGSGIMIEGKLYRGVTSRAGEFGHTTISLDGPLCHCGNTGCLERFASVITLIDNCFDGECREKDIINALFVTKELYLKGDKKAHQALLNEAKYLGVGIANIINAIDPYVVIVGGYIRVVWELIENHVIEEVRRRLAIRTPESVRIVGSSFQGLENLEGAAILAVSTVIPTQG